MDVVAAVIAVVLLVTLVVFQIALAAGAPWGTAAYGGSSATLAVRLRVTSVVAAVVWALVAWLFLSLVVPQLPGPVPESWNTVVLWVLVGLFAVATLMNAISRSRVERMIWTPVCAVLLVCAMISAFVSVSRAGLAG